MQLAHYYGVTPTITSTFRGWEEQTRLYSRYLRGQSRYPANQPGDSSHNYGLSFDSVVPAGDLPLWTAIREYVGFRVPPGDTIHAEVPNWRTLL
jgi:hypothetical protein